MARLQAGVRHHRPATAWCCSSRSAACCFAEHLENALFLGIAVSIYYALRRAEGFKLRVLTRGRRWQPSELTEGEPTRAGEITVLNLQGELFFAAAEELQAELMRMLDSARARDRAARARGLQHGRHHRRSARRTSPSERASAAAACSCAACARACTARSSAQAWCRDRRGCVVQGGARDPGVHEARRGVRASGGSRVESAPPAIFGVAPEDQAEWSSRETARSSQAAPRSRRVGCSHDPPQCCCRLWDDRSQAPLT